MNKLFYYFASKKLLMAQAKDLQRQWQEMREERDLALAVNATISDGRTYLIARLHEVTRERDNERKLRLEAEKLRDVYLEQLENEEE